MFFNKLLLTENFMICFFVENNEKSYVTSFIEKSSAFMKITLLFYYFYEFITAMWEENNLKKQKNK